MVKKIPSLDPRAESPRCSLSLLRTASLGSAAGGKGEDLWVVVALHLKDAP